MKIKRHVELPFLDVLTEFEVEIDGDYQPHRKATLTDPEVDSEFKIGAIWLGGADISGALGKPDLERIAEAALVDIIAKDRKMRELIAEYPRDFLQVTP